MGPIIVYTAITGDFDALRPAPELWRREASFVAFVDREHPCSGWTQRKLAATHHDPCRSAKVMKILPHLYFPDAEYTVWVDGSIEIIATTPLPQLLAEALQHHDIALFRHRRRSCIF